MMFSDIVRGLPSWLDAKPVAGPVLSSRARLARNISGVRYAHTADDTALGRVVGEVLESSRRAGFEPAWFFPNDGLDDLQKRVLIERHLISPALAAKNGNRGVLVGEGERSSILINEEDHLRFQSIRSGFDIEGALAEVDHIERRLGALLAFSFSPEFGYLTACPTNLGTGLRVSVLIHLPALVLSKEIPRALRSVSQLGLVVRGFHGEGTEVVGNLFQISNQRSLGMDAASLAAMLADVVADIIDFERRTAQEMLREARWQTEDRIWRSLGTLRSARILSSQEYLSLSSTVRLGCDLELLDPGFTATLNELLVHTQPGHLQLLNDGGDDPGERDRIRANLVRERFAALPL